jgi:ABC-type phosphate transport system permease subunit
MLVRVVAPHFVAGLVLSNGVVTGESAPILRYMTGWPRERASAYIRSKGWTANVIRCPNGKDA